MIFKIKFWDIELGNLVEHWKRLMYGNMMKDTTVTYHISYLVFDDCMVRWCRNSLIKHQEPRARSRHYEQWVDIQYLQFRTISTQYLHSIYTTQYPAETRQLLNSSWGYWREEARDQTDKIFMKVHRISKNLTLHCVYLHHTQIGSNASKRGPLTHVPWSRQNWNAQSRIDCWWMVLLDISGISLWCSLLSAWWPQHLRKKPGL